jgi:hypothetical protein
LAFSLTSDFAFVPVAYIECHITQPLQYRYINDKRRIADGYYRVCHTSKPEFQYQITSAQLVDGSTERTFEIKTTLRATVTSGMFLAEYYNIRKIPEQKHAHYRLCIVLRDVRSGNDVLAFRSTQITVNAHPSKPNAAASAAASGGSGVVDDPLRLEPGYAPKDMKELEGYREPKRFVQVLDYDTQTYMRQIEVLPADTFLTALQKVGVVCPALCTTSSSSSSSCCLDTHHVVTICYIALGTINYSTIVCSMLQTSGLRDTSKLFKHLSSTASTERAALQASSTAAVSDTCMHADTPRYMDRIDQHNEHSLMATIYPNIQ